MITQDVMVPAIILTLQQRPELPVTELGRELNLRGWRVHALGDYVIPEDLPIIASP